MTAAPPSRPPSQLRVAILANPSAGRHRPADLDRLAALLAADGVAVTRVTGARRGDLAAAAATLDVDAVAVAGGDGTLNGVVGALLARPAPRPLLAVVAQGTANVMVAEYGLPTRVEEIAAAIVARRTRPLHLGRLTGPDGRGRPFFLAASVGFDAEVVHSVEARDKRRFKRLAFLVTALRHGFRPRPAVRVRLVDPRGDSETHDLGMAVVAKASRYGGPFRLTHATAMDRPGLCLVGLRRVSPHRLFAAGLRLLAGRLEASPNAVVRPLVRARLASTGEPAAVQVDGEPHAFTPIEVEALDDALDLVVA